MATVAKLQRYGNQIAVIFSDGSRVLAYKVNSIWRVDTNANGVKALQYFGNLIKIIFNSGDTALAYPTTNSLWYVGPTADVGTPLFLWPFSLASSNPANGYPEDWFRTAGRPTHNGGDFGYGGATNGQPIGSAGNGTVIFSGVDGSYGYVVTVYHGTYNGRDWSTLYAHMQSGTNIANGTHVTIGETLGLVGTTGGSTGPHLHFETRENGIQIDPSIFMAEFNPTNGYVRP